MRWALFNGREGAGGEGEEGGGGLAGGFGVGGGEEGGEGVDGRGGGEGGDEGETLGFESLEAREDGLGERVAGPVAELGEGEVEGVGEVEGGEAWVQVGGEEGVEGRGVWLEELGRERGERGWFNAGSRRGREWSGMGRGGVHAGSLAWGRGEAREFVANDGILRTGASMARRIVWDGETAITG